MTASAQRLLDEARTLPEKDRIEMADALLESVPRDVPPDRRPPPEDLTPEEWIAAWAPELERRWAQVKSGEATLVPWEEVRAGLGKREPVDAH